MFGVKEFFALLLVTTFLNFELSEAHLITQNSEEWTNYKATYGKTYSPQKNPESYALYYYNYNKKLIASENVLADRGQRTYRLATNQFSDMRLIHFNALFPITTKPTKTSATTPPSVQDPPTTFDPTTDLGLTIEVEDQGTVCSSGWAYATSKAIEIFVANQMGLTQPTPLSAQNLIDCAGAGIGCIRQAAQKAFEYLVEYQQPLYNNTEYPNNKLLTTQSMCIPPLTSMGTPINLAQYARLNNGDDTTMMRYVAAGYPVVIEYDPTSFDFMHYKSGIFQQPHTSGGSHYMTVLGYGTDATTKLDYWLVLNSFGTTWGENGYIRIRRNVPLAKSALFPTTLT